jgi:hypothetical protein
MNASKRVIAELAKARDVLLIIERMPAASCYSELIVRAREKVEKVIRLTSIRESSVNVNKLSDVVQLVIQVFNLVFQLVAGFKVT